MGSCHVRGDLLGLGELSPVSAGISLGTLGSRVHSIDIHTLHGNIEGGPFVSGMSGGFLLGLGRGLPNQ